MDMEIENDYTQPPPVSPQPRAVNFSVKYQANQGDRMYMEDQIRFALEKDSDGTILTSFFGLFDGHGGMEASEYTKTHLLSHIVSHPEFHSNDDSLILLAIKEGFASLQRAMLLERTHNWPRLPSGRLSIAGTTATVVFFKNGKLYIANVGDSAVVLGYQTPEDRKKGTWRARQITKDHKPESPLEKRRIEEAGAKVIKHNGIYRIKTQQASTLLNVGRALGDFWSWNPDRSAYIVSPVPDTMVLTLNPEVHKCLILASDGLWNVMSAEKAVNFVKSSVKIKARRQRQGRKTEVDNHIDRLIKKAKDNWKLCNIRADNITAMSIVFDFVY